MQVVLTDEFEQLLARYRVLYQRELHHIHITEVVEGMVGVVDVGHTTTHTSGEVTTCLTQHNHASASHILAAMVASTLDDSDGT